MKLLLFSPANDHQKEILLLPHFFEKGLETYHLRKPTYSITELEKLIQQIPSEYYSRIMLHSHHILVEKYKLKGCHFTEKKRSEIDKLDKKKGFLYSTGFHNIEDAKSGITVFDWDYIFLSPIYDSISKNNYKSHFSDEILKTKLLPLLKQKNVFALGGVQLEHIVQLQKYGFTGYGILGSIWNSSDPLKSFEKFIKNTKTI